MPLDHLATLLPDTTSIAQVLRTAGADAPVPGCPGWMLGDLVRHLAQVHAWAAEVVRTGERSGWEPVEAAGDALPDLLLDGAGRLQQVLADADPDRHCWTLAGAGTTAFWRRRQALETAVHRVDAQRALGPADPVPDELAEDGVAEVVDVLQPRQVALGRSPAPPAGVELVSTTGRRWTLGPQPTRARLTATPSELLLVLWRRAGPGPVDGDRDVLEALLAGGVTP